MTSFRQGRQRHSPQAWIVVAITAFSAAIISGRQTSAQPFSAKATPSNQKGDGSTEITEIKVTKSFNNDPFRVLLRQTASKRGYRIYRLTYPSPVETAHKPNNTVPADYYLPDGMEPGSPRRPAVVCLHILNGNYELVRMLCTSLAQRGVPAIMFKLPYYGERALPGGRRELARNGRLFVEALSQAMLDARRTFDVLAALPQIDPERIGIAGISLGSFVSAATAGSDGRFHRTALLLSGGDLLSIIHESNETSSLSSQINSLPTDQQQEIKRAIIAVDPITHAPGLRDRALAGRVLMINGDQDQVVPPASTKKLAKALGISDKVFWLEGLGHYSAAARLPEIMRRTVDFFAQDLPPGILPPTVDATVNGKETDDPIVLLANLVAQSASVLTVPPSEGRCHIVDIDVEVTEASGKTHAGNLNFVRGTDHRFKLQLDVPVLGKAFFGQDTHPWMATDQAVFLGSASGDAETSDPLTFAETPHLAKVKMVAGAMATLPLAPALLEQLVLVRTEILSDETLALKVLPRKEKDEGSIEIAFQQDQKTPKSLSFDVNGLRGKLTMRSWQSNSFAFPALFQPPPGLPTEEVQQTDILRIFAALFNFALELTE